MKVSIYQQAHSNVILQLIPILWKYMQNFPRIKRCTLIKVVGYFKQRIYFGFERKIQLHFSTILLTTVKRVDFHQSDSNCQVYKWV